MAKVEIFKPKSKFRNPKPLIANKQERLLQMLRLMALAYRTRSKTRREKDVLPKPVFIEVKMKYGSKR